MLHKIWLLRLFVVLMFSAAFMVRNQSMEWSYIMFGHNQELSTASGEFTLLKKHQQEIHLVNYRFPEESGYRKSGVSKRTEHYFFDLIMVWSWISVLLFVILLVRRKDKS